MTDQTPLSTVSKEPRLYGVIDLLRSDRVAGWVIDRTDPSRTAMVDVPVSYTHLTLPTKA